jgi:hypothetical protein
MVRIPRNAMQTITKSKVATLVVNRTVLAEAIRAANGDPARLEIIDADTITVWNSREQRDKIVKRRKGTVNRPSQRSPMAGRPQDIA